MTVLQFCSTTSKSRLIQMTLLSLPFVKKSFTTNWTRPFSCKSRGPPWRILFFGSDDFSLKSLQFLCSKYRTGTLISRLDVVTNNPHNIIGKFVQEEKLDYSLWPVDESLVKGQFDLGIVVSFGHLIPEVIINSFPLGMINAHASLLPRWRGASPIVYSLLSGDQETGVTIIKLSPKKFDQGDMIRQYRCSIAADETNPTLRERLAQHSAELLLEIVRDLPRCLDYSQPQPKSGVTYAPKLDKNLSTIQWDSMTSHDIFNRHRALANVQPLTTKWKDHTVKFLNVSMDQSDLSSEKVTTSDSESVRTASALAFLNVSKKKDFGVGGGKSAVSFLNTDNFPKGIKTSSQVKPGLVIYDKARQLLRIQCCDGRKILVDKVAVAGKKSMSAADFNNGFLSKVPDKSEWIFSS